MTEPGKLWPCVSPLRTEQERSELIGCAFADGHAVLAPSHVIRVGGQIVGYFSLGGLTVLNAWVSAKAVAPRESHYALNLAENLAAAAGVKRLLLPCAEGSPFMPHIERLGYARLGTTTLNWKEL